MFHSASHFAAPIGRVCSRNSCGSWLIGSRNQSRSVSSNSSDDDSYGVALSRNTNSNTKSLSTKSTTVTWKSLTTNCSPQENKLFDFLNAHSRDNAESRGETNRSSASASTSASSFDTYVCTCSGFIRCINCLHSRLHAVEEQAKQAKITPTSAHTSSTPTPDSFDWMPTPWASTATHHEATNQWSFARVGSQDVNNSQRKESKVQKLRLKK
eukprot:TRINITY_DN6331_c0_g1_i1.p1 TRINITY_DN6331_c0_g1~~TRINITY_DN6331_c0_g1_i1.p1  ORF type:complete len:212 (-),score=43.95 TRINITY_DN6331_c0_g1_i1:238-873(-)